MSDTWMKQGACAETDPELFFAPDGERQAAGDVREIRAKRICSGCPVRIACLDYAIGNGLKHGVWGGMGEEQRANEIRRRRRRAKAAVA